MSRFSNLPIRRIAAGVLTTSAVVLGGCAAQGGMAQRADAQAALAHKEVAERPPMVADNRATHVQLVTQMQQKDLYFASLAHIDALQQRWGIDPESNLLRADALRHTGQADQARALYSDLLASPQKARAAHGLGLLAGRAGDYPRAAVYLQQASLAAPTDADMLNDLGFVLMQQGQWTDARLPLMKASELASDNPRIWSNVALFLMLSGQPAQAEEVVAGRKLSEVARNQIAELASSIRARASAPAVSSLPATPTASVMAFAKDVAIRADAAEAQLKPVLTPSFGIARLMTVTASNP